MDKIVDHLFVFRGKGKIEDFPGNYSDFRAYDGLTTTSETPKKKVKADWKNKTENKPSNEEQRALKKLEKEIAALEAEKENIQHQFTDGTLSPEDIKALSIELTSVEKALEAKTDAWLERSLALE